MSFNICNQMNIINWEVSMYNDFVLFVEVMISLLVLASILICFMSHFAQKMLHWNFLEIFWSFLPSFILIFLGFPAIKLLYMTETFSSFSLLNLKVLGHQWYWEYNLPEFNVKFESYPNLICKMFRLGETTTSLVLPMGSNIRAIVTSFDVLHSWAIPSLGIKIDACPGRLNFVLINCSKPGLYIGQCSELCGNFHHLMPIFLEITSYCLFLEWLKTKI